ncbi:MAG: hypothetical protein ACR2JR_08775 [Rubrobacteraceae bacterium]
MGKSLIAGLGLVSMLGALVVGAYLVVGSLGDDPAGGASSGTRQAHSYSGYPALQA